MDHVSLTEAGAGVVVMTIDRPPVNAMDLALLAQINAAVAQLALRPPAALVVAGRSGAFSAGVDLKAEPTYGPDERRRLFAAIDEMALGVYELPFPVVGAITGHAIAGGLVLALCTDVRVASSAGRYGLTEVAVGIAYPPGAIGVVAAELAPHAARKLVLGGALHSAEECLTLGLFDELVEPQQVLGRAIESATALTAYPAEVFELSKRQLRGASIGRLRAAAAKAHGPRA